MIHLTFPMMAQENQMTKLESMVGTWTCVETYHAGGWSETEVVSTQATDVISYGINQQYITATYKSESAIGSYRAYDLIYYDADTEAYVFSFFDNFGNQQIQKGKWLSDNQIVFSHAMEMNGKSGEFQRLYTFESSHKQTLEVSFVAGDFTQKLITITKKKS
ncbi:MAG: DUF1579 family protein [Bacteroidota bacterium]